ncbi:hypothetical protein EVAR_43822_1 [Eumeta japonica]|uniref:Uncharacterized protein n=1 Tax=Eumeta variegata TaxID=151549 RepID=A0A4C1WYX6_EUMVA|nr:hypothetical protein EVAR_43822_1 [Eumeta japonica]
MSTDVSDGITEKVNKDNERSNDEIVEEKEIITQRKVSFPDEEHLVTQYFEAADPWQDAQRGCGIRIDGREGDPNKGSVFAQVARNPGKIMGYRQDNRFQDSRLDSDERLDVYPASISNRKGDDARSGSTRSPRADGQGIRFQICILLRRPGRFIQRFQNYLS